MTLRVPLLSARSLGLVGEVVALELVLSLVIAIGMPRSWLLWNMLSAVWALGVAVLITGGSLDELLTLWLPNEATMLLMWMLVPLVVSFDRTLVIRVLVGCGRLSVLV